MIKNLNKYQQLFVKNTFWSGLWLKQFQVTAKEPDSDKINS